MRVAIFEMTSPELEVPQTVALNEAIEIAKHTVTKNQRNLLMVSYQT